MVANKDVVRVRDPETSRSLVGIQQTPRPSRAHNKVVLDDVLGLDCVFNEDVVTHSIVNNVVLNRKIRNSVNSHCTIIALMNGIALHE